MYYNQLNPTQHKNNPYRNPFVQNVKWPEVLVQGPRANQGEGVNPSGQPDRFSQIFLLFSDLSMGEPNTPSVFYHYTTPENLENIKRQGMILPFPRSPLIPSGFAGFDLKDTATIFFTRMDPSNPKESIAFNNYG